MSLQRDVRHAKRRAMEQLTALRDEARLQLHLLTMDGRKAWRAIEKEIAVLEERALDESDIAAEVLADVAQSLTRKLNDFMKKHQNHSVGLLTNVRWLMATQIRSCRPDDSLIRAAELMWESDCGGLPVVADENVLGIITDRDVCMATYTSGKPLSELTVESAMSKEVFSCAPDESIGSMLAIMGENRVRRLPVVSHDGKLLGIITLAAVARWARSLTNPAVDAAVTDALGRISTLSPQRATHVGK